VKTRLAKVRTGFTKALRVILFTFVLIGCTSALNAHALTEEALASASDWSVGELSKAEEYDLLTEKVQGNFKRKITREEFSELAVKLYEALVGEKAVAVNTNPFIDTQNPSIASAYGLGIVNGLGNGRFAPDYTATRQEVSVMLYRTLKAAKPEYDFSIGNVHTFTDEARISPWAHDSVKYLYDSGVITGTGNNRFNPEGTATREEAVILIKRVYEKYVLSAEVIYQPGRTESKDSSEQNGDYANVSRGSCLADTFEKLKSLIEPEMGKPYQWGATGPDSYDCSGLVYTLYGKLGIDLPRVSASQATAGVYVPKEELRYGDLVFFAADGKNVNHVGIYVENGEFVHAPSTGSVVKKSTLISGYYQRTYFTARRVIR